MKRFFLFIVLLFLWNNTKACLILFLKDSNNVLVGNHEDWFAKDAAIKINPAAKNKFGSVIFTFESEGWAQGGMNEKGLFFDGTYTPFQEVTFNDNTEKFNGYIWQQVLDQFSNVEEALSFIQKYQLPDLQEAHIFLADAQGNSAIVGVENGKLAIQRNIGNHQLLTNFNPWHPELSE